MRVKGSTVKHFQQRKVKHEKKNFSRKWREKVKKRNGFFSEKMLQKKESKGEKKVVEMRRH